MTAEHDAHVAKSDEAVTPGVPSPLLTQFLAEQDVPCPACGYSLRGLKGAACPECAQPLVLRVALAEPSSWRYVAAMVALAVGMGFSGPVSILVSWMGLNGEEMRRLVFGLVLPFVIESAAMFLLVRNARAFQRMSSHRQGWVILACCAFSLAIFASFLLIVAD